MEPLNINRLNQTNHIDTILFDLDGTLVHHAHALMPAFLARWGYTRSLECVEAAVDEHLDWLYEQTRRNNGVWTDEAYVEFNARILSTLRIPDPTGEVTAQATEYFSSEPVPPLFSDVLPLLTRMRAPTVRLGVITQRGRAGASKFLRTHKLLERFDTLVAGDDGHGRKPDTGPFAAALEAIGSAPERAIYIGDRIDDDCEGAAAAGLLPFLIDRKGHHVAAAQDAPFIHLRSLLELGAHLPTLASSLRSSPPPE